jgi:hypothetical protein
VIIRTLSSKNLVEGSCIQLCVMSLDLGIFVEGIMLCAWVIPSFYTCININTDSVELQSLN